jgi:hypothetical protein
MPQSPTTNKISTFLRIDRPESRYLAVESFLSSKKYTKRKAIPKDFSEYQSIYINLHRGLESEEAELSSDVLCVQKAVLLHTIPSCRALLNGFLISNESPVTIAALINESPGVVSSYSHLFFDTSVFFNDLLKVAYIRSLPSDDESQVFEKQVLSWGHYLGAKYIAWKIGSKNSTEILPSQAVKKVLDDSMWRSSEHALEDITSKKAKESRAWVPQVLRSAELLNNLETTAGMENALSELKIKLTTEDLQDPEIDMSEIKG